MLTKKQKELLIQLANLIAEIQNEIDIQYEQYNNPEFEEIVGNIFDNSDDLLTMHEIIKKILREED